MTAVASQSYGPYLGRNAAGHLQVEGHDCLDLAREFGLPLWVLSEQTIRHNYRHLLKSFREQYERTRIVYASKANPQPAVMRVARDEGALVDVVTMGHIVLAERAGYPPSELVFNGNAKTTEELGWACARGVAMINVDSLAEMELLARIQPVTGPPRSLCLRLATDAELYADDPEFAAAQGRSKFGLQERDAHAAVEIARRHPTLDVVGVHSHIGWTAYGIPYSRELDLERHRRETERVMDFAESLSADHGVDVRCLNLGGGFRVGRREGFGPGAIREFPSADEYARVVAGTVARRLERGRLGSPTLLIEAGAYLVADAGLLLAQVGSSKRSRAGGGRNWAFVENTSAYHFARRLMFDFTHAAVAVGDDRPPASEPVTLAGPVCTTDTLAQDQALPTLERGDVVALLDQGAYCESVTSDYCAIPIPAVAMVREGAAALTRRRETVEDIAARFDIPPWLGQS